MGQYLSYSGFKAERDCGFGWWLKYGRDKKELDLGLPLENCVNTLFGDTVGHIFEDFYNEKLWKNKSKTTQVLLDRVDETFKKVCKEQTKLDRFTGKATRTINWEDDIANYHTPEEVLVDVREAVVRGMNIIRVYQLLGPYTKAEVKLDIKQDGDTYAGRADFIMDRIAPHNDRIILDGKGTKNPQWVDPDQLRWYGMLHRERYGKTPDKMGFLLWRLDPMQSIDWLSFSEDDLEKMYWDALKATRRIKKRMAQLKGIHRLDVVQEVFSPRPSDDACRFCPFARPGICDKGAPLFEKLRKRAAQNRKKRCK